MLIRASIGTLALLDLMSVKMLEKPTVAYLLQYSEEGCYASCAFCPQSRVGEARKDLVSRIPWPAISMEAFMERFSRRENRFSRICLQSVLKIGFEEEILNIIEEVRGAGVNSPISVATTPVSTNVLKKLRGLGVDCLGIGLDAASKNVFKAIGKPYSWKEYWKFIERAVEIFGFRKVYVHLIFGLGETERQFAEGLQLIYEKGAEAALFAFTPISGTPMEQYPKPRIERYRVMQVIRYLLSMGYRLEELVRFSGEQVKLEKTAHMENIANAFLTSGCPGCNRPFYNERVTEIYNYPSTKLLLRDLPDLMKQLKAVDLGD